MPESNEQERGSSSELVGLFWPVSAMFSTQSVSVLVFLTVPVMATEIAPVFGVEAKDIGVFMSVVFAAAMLCSAASGSLIRRYGGIRSIQIGIAFLSVLSVARDKRLAAIVNLGGGTCRGGLRPEYTGGRACTRTRNAAACAWIRIFA